jgi:hypothetical protein
MGLKKSVGGVLVPEAPDFEDIVRRIGKRVESRQYRVGHDGLFNALKSGDGWATAPENTRDMNHRNWEDHARAVVGEMAGYNMVSEMALKHDASPAFKKDCLRADLLKPVSEMIGTSDGAMDLVEKVRIDIELGLADVPLLYQPLYDRIDGPFPGGAVQIGGDVLFDAHVVFLQHFEGEEIVFGTLAKQGAPTFVPIATYAAGFEWTEDILEYDRSYEIGMNAKAFGRSYNYLLNHNHFSPILAYTYTGANQTAADATASETLQAHTLRTFQAAYRKGAMATTQRVPSWILANEADRFTIEDALLSPVLDANGNQLRRVPVEGIIYYQGATVTNGVTSYVYPGVTAGKCYFIMPKMRMKELVHHDLRVDVGPGDITRLIEGQQVARTRRGLYLDIANSVEEVTLPTS